MAIELFAKGKLENIEDLPSDVFYTFNYTPLNQEKIKKLNEVLAFCKSEAKRLGEEYLKK
ncbi:hypothetical protein [Sphingobacterium hungaricum]|uniref:Uncharacterized protein n=1 Tax=Sphingobacterium hungaricum TaxID=2082723 RepID=A0A928V1I7_9SPHI|nr:hypothetical protein [Sphingobacterium hungaricum]MBE8714797.1 hypothetical protein [Sphingobacterium hungaricum]